MLEMQQHEDRQQSVAQLVAVAETQGRVTNATHELTLEEDSPEIRVRDLRTGALVAFSSTRADFQQSLEEFVLDFFC